MGWRERRRLYRLGHHLCESCKVTFVGLGALGEAQAARGRPRYVLGRLTVEVVAEHVKSVRERW